MQVLIFCWNIGGNTYSSSCFDLISTIKQLHNQQLRRNYRVSQKHLWLAAALLTCVALPLAAHHSFAAEFDGSKTLSMKGVVSKVDWVNPHIFIYIDVKDDSGKAT